MREPIHKRQIKLDSGAVLQVTYQRDGEEIHVKCRGKRPIIVRPRPGNLAADKSFAAVLDAGASSRRIFGASPEGVARLMINQAWS